MKLLVVNFINELVLAWNGYNIKRKLLYIINRVT